MESISPYSPPTLFFIVCIDLMPKERVYYFVMENECGTKKLPSGLWNFSI